MAYHKLIGVGLLALVLAVPAVAVTKMLEFDMVNSMVTTKTIAPGTTFLSNTGAWQVIPATLAVGSAVMPEGTNTGLGGNRLSYSSGAGIAGVGRPYIYLDTLAYVTSTAPASSGTNMGTNVFAEYPNVDRIGYSEIGYYYVAGNGTATIGLGGYVVGIGSIQNAGNQSLFMFYNGSSLTSRTTIRDAGGYHTLTDVSLTFVPRNEWFMLTKIVDIEEMEIRFYLNDALLPAYSMAITGIDKDTIKLSDIGAGSSGVDDKRGAIGGEARRQATGIGFSYYAMYEGVVSESERLATYTYLTTVVPEPATMTLLVLGGLAMLRRRGR